MDIGVLFYSKYNRNDHMPNICKSSNHNLYSIGKVRKYLDTPNRREDDQFFFNITPVLLQLPTLCCKWLF